MVDLDHLKSRFATLTNIFVCYF